jgi:GNAT superfamily N-acetyltransferase
MQIDFLANHLGFVEQLAAWHHSQWSYLHPGETLEERTERLRTKCTHGGIPTMLVAFDKEELIGSAGLGALDMETRRDLTPWLASVFVARRRRGKGFGAQLVGRAEQEARKAGVAELYLYTPDVTEFYRKLGWRSHLQVHYRGRDVTIMAKSLAAKG